MTKTPCVLPALFSISSLFGLWACGGDDGPADTAAESSSDTQIPTASADGSMSVGMTDDDSLSTTATETAADTSGACSVTPGDWSAPEWDAHVAAEMTLRSTLADLVGTPFMRGAETGDVSIASLGQLEDAYEAELAAFTHVGFDATVRNSLAEFFDVLEVGPRDLMDDGAWAPGPAGGIWGDSARGINEGGIEVRQIVDKGLFAGGAFYHHALQLTEGPIDEGTIDKLAYIWGNNAELNPRSDTPLVGSANYSYRQGFHTQMAASLTAAKAYAQDPACEEQRDEAIVEFFRAWELSMMSRVVYYVAQMATRLAVAATQDEFAEALHQLAEGLGLASGFHELPDPSAGPLAGAGRVIGDAEIAEILDALGFDMLDQGASTTGAFVESLPAFETAQAAAETVIRDTYGVDQTTIASWRTPTSG